MRKCHNAVSEPSAASLSMNWDRESLNQNAWLSSFRAEKTNRWVWSKIHTLLKIRESVSWWRWRLILMAGPLNCVMKAGCFHLCLPLPYTVFALGPVCSVPGTWKVLNKHWTQPRLGPEAQSAVTCKPRGSVQRAQGFPQQVSILVPGANTATTYSREMLDRNESITKAVDITEQPGQVGRESRGQQRFLCDCWWAVETSTGKSTLCLAPELRP